MKINLLAVKMDYMGQRYYNEWFFLILCMFMLPATLYTASICVVCLVHEKEKTDLQCDMSFDAGIRHLNQIIEIMLGFSF